MEQYIRKNISILLSIFILLNPFLDLLTGIGLHYFNRNLTVGIIIRVLFLFFICFTTIFIYKKKKLLVPYLLIGIYMIFAVTGIFLYKNGNGLLIEVHTDPEKSMCDSSQTISLKEFDEIIEYMNS